MAQSQSERDKLKVLAVYPWPAFWSMGEGRGAAPFFHSVTSFPRHGHEMHVVLPGHRDRPGEEDYHGVSLHRFPTAVDFMPDVGRSKIVQHMKLFFTYIYWFARSIPAGLSLASRIRPDVIFGMGALGAQAGYVIARLRGLPNVTRLFGTSIGQVVGHPLKYGLRYREINAFRTPASYLVICDDGSGGDDVAKMLGADMSRFMFWPDAVDKGRYTSKESGTAVATRLGIPPGNRVVLSVSRLHPEKHVDRLLAAAPRVLEERSDVTFLIVGSGEEEDELRGLADRLGVGKHVLFTGAVSHDELPGIYGAADLFVTLSDRTNVCNPLHEAMISGLAVVALDTGRTSDVVKDGESGVLLNEADLPRLPDVILGLLSDDERRHSLGRGAQESADRRLPTTEERQAMEVEIVERAVREHRAGCRRA